MEDMETYIGQAINGAAICLLWQASDASEDGGAGFPITDGGNDYSAVVVETVPYFTEAVTAFVTDNYTLLQGARVEAGQAGHDLILTANGHGAGFWDRGLGEAGTALTEACKGYSFDAMFMLDDDGDVTWLCVENVVIVDENGLASDPTDNDDNENYRPTGTG